MARPKANIAKSGAFAHKFNDPERNKPSWFSLGGYFEKKGRGVRSRKESSMSQQNIKNGNRGKRNN